MGMQTRRSIEQMELELEHLEKEVNQCNKLDKAEWLRKVSNYNALKIQIYNLKGITVSVGYYPGDMTINPLNRY